MPSRPTSVGRPRAALEEHAVEPNVSLLVLAVEPHQVDRRVLGEAVVVRPQDGPDIAIWRADRSVLGVAHVEIAEDDRVFGVAQRTEDAAELPGTRNRRAAFPLSRWIAATVTGRPLTCEFGQSEAAGQVGRQPGVADAIDRNAGQHQQP